MKLEIVQNFDGRLFSNCFQYLLGPDDEFSIVIFSI